MTPYTAYGRAARQYQHTDIAAADDEHPQRRVELVFSAILTSLAQALRAHHAALPGRRGEQIGHAMTLIGMLRAALDHTAAPELARRLDALYAYCNRRLLAVAIGDTDALQEVIDLIVTVKSGWDSLPADLSAAA